jgi:TPR repeat protein
MFDAAHFLAESGIESSMKDIISDVLSTGKNAVTPEKADMALRYLNTLAEKNDHDALLSLGALYYTGLGDLIRQDYAKAMSYYEKAAEISELRNDWALNNLGYCHYYGRNGKVDYEKAYSCFALSAMYGNPNAMYKLGDMYYSGNFVDKDFTASFYWYTMAKEQKTIQIRIIRAFLPQVSLCGLAALFFLAKEQRLTLSMRFLNCVQQRFYFSIRC